MQLKALSIILLTLSLLVSPIGWADPIRLSEPVVADNYSETFGEMIDVSAEAVDLAALVNQPNRYLGKQTLVKTSIAKVCQKKGCFFIAQQDQHILRVAFKDYGFFIPTDSGGKTVLLSGELIEKEMTADQAAHFKADLKTESPALSAGKVYEIIANGIQIPRS